MGCTDIMYTVWSQVCGPLTITPIWACWTSYSITMGDNMELGCISLFWEGFSQEFVVSVGMCEVRRVRLQRTAARSVSLSGLLLRGLADVTPRHFHNIYILLAGVDVGDHNFTNWLVVKVAYDSAMFKLLEPFSTFNVCLWRLHGCAWFYAHVGMAKTCKLNN